MKKSITIAVCLLGVAGIYWFAQAGDLEPGAPPGSTMHTLEEIYDKLDECTGGSSGPCGVPKTGQTSSYGTGDDGEYQLGVAVDPRFTDNGDGTVTDNLTGLIWLEDANCFGPRDWTDALADANALTDGVCGLTDSSAAGDWRLPNVRELQSLIDFGQWDPALLSGHPFSGVELYNYWSSTSTAFNQNFAWYVDLYTGFVLTEGKSNGHFIWPVRGGQ